MNWWRHCKWHARRFRQCWFIIGISRLGRDGSQWWRLGDGGPGIVIHDERSAPLFSERNGYRRRLVFGRYRILWLRPDAEMRERARRRRIEHPERFHAQGP